MISLEDAYVECEAITKAEAKNFAYGIRLLPSQKRKAMSALYAFARRVDDIGDGAAPPSEKLAALSDVRKQIASVAADAAPEDDLVLIALADATKQYDIPTAALEEIVVGCEMDCNAVRYETFDDLATYCRCVAGSIGRLSLAVFGYEQQNAPQLADTLGIGLQVTNILRDIVEDRDVMGRVYIPEEDLDRFGCNRDVTGSPEALAALVRFEVTRAKERYAEGLELLGALDHWSRACVSAMAGIYRRLLLRIEADPLSVFDRRVSIPTWEKLWVAAGSVTVGRA